MEDHRRLRRLIAALACLCAAGASGCAGLGRSRTPGLIANGWNMCNVNYPNGVQGPQKALVQAFIGYNAGVSQGEFQQIQQRLANRAVAALAASASGSVSYTFPPQKPYNLWVTITYLRDPQSLPPEPEGCDPIGMVAEPCPDPPNATYWAMARVSGWERGWLFNYFTRSFSEQDALRDPSRNSLEALTDETLSTLGGYLANGWKCTPDGRITR